MSLSSNLSSVSPKVSIIGAGVIGLSIGWRLQKIGLHTQIFDTSEHGKNASWAAAGMLAPQAEVGFEEIPFLKLGEESLSLYPKFLAELYYDSGISVDFDTRGTLMVSLDRDDNQWLKRLFQFRQEIGLPVEWLSGEQAREKEPLLSPKAVSAIWFERDGQIDNRQLLDALRIAYLKLGGIINSNAKVTKILLDRDQQLKALEVARGTNEKEEISTSSVILAAGAWSNLIDGYEFKFRPPVRPVKGQILTLKMNSDSTLSKVIRTARCYFAPKLDGRLVLGATTEDKGFDTTKTAGAALTLLEEGFAAIPAIYEMELIEHLTGFRPGSRDNEPMIGETGIENLLFATGHYRHGVLLTPITALFFEEYFRNLLTLSQFNLPSALFQPFSPKRFLQSQIH
ncbi:MAG: glycine oxidase ThiO [Chloroherpetonaceae bacterium]|nr:glycine oxidase ThiO [Chloroherpetonaceae bacterium]